MKMKICPFCNGEAKVSFRQYRFWGKNYLGDRKLSYIVQVICKKCRSRGKPIVTEYLINPNPWHRPEEFEKYIEMAVEEWNRRGGVKE